MTPPSPATLQDPLSIRCLPSIHGALYDAAHHARIAVEIELASAGDNPLVLADDGAVMSTGNFHTAALSLAFETLGLAIAQAAAASAARFIQLTGSGRNGLPKYLSPVGGASAGFVPLQKTVTAILAAIRHEANPVMLDFLPVSEGVEDHAAQTPLVVAKCAEMIALWRRLIAFELMAAAQAVDLRGRSDARAGHAAQVHAAVRAHRREAARGPAARRGRRSALRGAFQREVAGVAAAVFGVGQQSAPRPGSAPAPAGSACGNGSPTAGATGSGFRRTSTSLVRLCSGSMTGLADSSACV